MDREVTKTTGIWRQNTCDEGTSTTHHGNTMKTLVKSRVSANRIRKDDGKGKEYHGRLSLWEEHGSWSEDNHGCCHENKSFKKIADTHNA